MIRSRQAMCPECNVGFYLLVEWHTFMYQKVTKTDENVLTSMICQNLSHTYDLQCQPVYNSLLCLIIYRVRDSIRNLGANIVTMNVSVFIRPNFAIEVEEIGDNFDGGEFVVALDGNGRLGEDSLNSGSDGPTSSIDLPPTLLEGISTSDDTRLVFGTYVDDSFYVQKVDNKMTVKGIIISADVYNDLGSVAVEGLAVPIRLNFVPSDMQSPSRCVFYNEEDSCKCIFWHTLTLK